MIRKEPASDGLNSILPESRKVREEDPALHTAAVVDRSGTIGEPAAVGPGRCIPDPLATNRFNQTSCFDPSATIAVAANPTVRTVLWGDFTGGKPETAVSPSEIFGIYWFVPAPPGAGTASPTTYPLDIVIDNLAFVP